MGQATVENYTKHMKNTQGRSHDSR